MNTLLAACTDLMDTMQAIPQVVIAHVHGLATAAGCQLVATCDLAVAAATAGFAAPGGKGGWFCTTPMVSIGRNLARKHAFELALTGDTIDAATALSWGLVNRVVPDDELDAATRDLLARATRGSASSKAIGKQALYRQFGLDQPSRLRVRHGGHGGGEPDSRRAGGDGVVPREASAEVRPPLTRSAGGTSAPGQTATGGRAHTKTYCVLGTGVPGNGLWLTTTQVSCPRTRWFAS